MKKIIAFFSNKNIGVIVILSLIIIVLAAIIIFGSDKEKKISTQDTNAFLIDPSRQFYKADDLVVNVQFLRNELALLEKNPNVSVYFEALNTGANISTNKDAEFFPASLLKVPLVMAVAKKIERGELRWDTKLELREAEKNKDFGELWKQPAGTLFTVEELVKQTLTKSDNTAYFVLLDQISPDELTKVQDHLGLTDFISANLEISARKYAPILRSLYSATYLTIEDSKMILNWMTESKFNDFLDGGVPPNVKFSHKIGIDDEKKVYLDAGIVYLPNRAYILIVMVKNYNANEAGAIMTDVSRRIYNYMLNYPKNI